MTELLKFKIMGGHLRLLDASSKAILVVKSKLILSSWLHHLLEGRNPRLSRCTSSQPTHQVNEIDRRGNGDMPQMRFGEAEVA